MLPPVDCLFAWLGEQVLVHLFGGSPMANSLRYPFLAMLSYHLKSLLHFFTILSLATIDLNVAMKLVNYVSKKDNYHAILQYL